MSIFKDRPGDLPYDEQYLSKTTTQKDLGVTTVNITRDVIKCSKCGQSISIDKEFIKSIKSNMSTKFISALLKLPFYLEKYKANTCRDLVNFLAQSQIETLNYTALRENLNYTKKTFENGAKVYSISPTTINNGFERKGLGSYTKQQKIDYIEKYLMDNDKAYGFHLYGNEKYPQNDYRGRGFMHFTHFEQYKNFTEETGINIVEDPTLLEKDGEVALETATWFWKHKANGKILKETALDTSNFQSDLVTTKVTRLVNGGSMNLTQRKTAKRSIGTKFVNAYGACQ